MVRAVPSKAKPLRPNKLGDCASLFGGFRLSRKRHSAVCCALATRETPNPPNRLVAQNLGRVWPFFLVHLVRCRRNTAQEPENEAGGPQPIGPAI